MSDCDSSDGNERSEAQSKYSMINLKIALTTIKPGQVFRLDW